MFRAGVHNALKRPNRCWKEQAKFKQMFQSVFNETGVAMCCQVTLIDIFALSGRLLNGLYYTSYITIPFQLQVDGCNLSIDKDFIQMQNMLSSMDQRQREKFTEDTCGLPVSIFSIVNLYPFLSELRKSPPLIGNPVIVLS